MSHFRIFLVWEVVVTVWWRAAMLHLVCFGGPRRGACPNTRRTTRGGPTLMTPRAAPRPRPKASPEASSRLCQRLTCEVLRLAKWASLWGYLCCGGKYAEGERPPFITGWFSMGCGGSSRRGAVLPGIHCTRSNKTDVYLRTIEDNLACLVCFGSPSSWTIQKWGWTPSYLYRLKSKSRLNLTQFQDSLKHLCSVCFMRLIGVVATLSVSRKIRWGWTLFDFGCLKFWYERQDSVKVRHFV